MLELSTKISGDRLTASEWANHSKELENVVTKNNLPLGNEEENLYNAILRMGKKSGIIKIYTPDIIDDDDNDKTWFVINDTELTDINNLEVGDSIYVDFKNGKDAKYFSRPELQIGDGDLIPIRNLDWLYTDRDPLYTKYMVDFPNPMLLTRKDDYYLIDKFFLAYHYINLNNHDDIDDIIDVDDTYMNDLNFTKYSAKLRVNRDVNTLSVYNKITIEGSDTLIKDNLIKGDIDLNTHHVINDFFKTPNGGIYQYGNNPVISFTFEYVDSDDDANSYVFPEIVATGYDYGGLKHSDLNTKLLELDGTKDRYNKLTIETTINYIGHLFLYSADVEL